MKKVSATLFFLFVSICAHAGGIGATSMWSQQTSIKVKQVAVGFSHVCVILDDGNVKCWGENANGQLGYGHYNKIGNASGQLNTLANVNLGTGRKAIQISAGEVNTCAILDNFKVKCWGSNSVGQLGLGDTTERGGLANQMGDNLPYLNLGTNRTAVQVSVGSNHSCVLLDNSQIKCFGYNGSGQLGINNTQIYGDDPSRVGDSIPNVNLGTNKKAIKVIAGFWNTCALLDDSTLKCWGKNDSGQAGQDLNYDLGTDPNEVGDLLPAINLGTNRKVLQFSTFGATACAVLDDSSVKCWGANHNSQVGIGTNDNLIGDGFNNSGVSTNEMGDTLVAVSLGTNRKVLQIASGSHHNCALLDNSTVKCWGFNGAGQLGLGDTSNRGGSAATLGNNLSVVSLGTNRKVIQLAAGGLTTCAVLDNGSLKCWGDNSSGQLGVGNTTNLGTSAAQMGDALKTIYLGKNPSRLIKLRMQPFDRTNQIMDKQLAGGQYHNCAIFGNSTVKCWGDNASYQLGISTNVAPQGDNASEMGDNLLSVDLGTNKYALQVAAGDKSSCAVTDDSLAKCWGANAVGQLGRNNTTTVGNVANQMGDNLAAIDLGTNRTVKQISLNGKHVCAILDNSKLKCWGENVNGELGDGTVVHKGKAANEMGDNLAYVDLGTNRTALQVATGVNHTCAILDDRTVKCWGQNTEGQVGIGSKVNVLSPGLVDLGSNRKALQLVGGDTFTCALLDNHEVKCWGKASRGQLGQENTYSKGTGEANSSMGDSLSAINLGTNKKAMQLSSSNENACALLNDGTMKCWGFNSKGQLGQGNTTNLGLTVGSMGDSLPTVSLGTDKILTQIMSGRYHTCSVFTDATVKCWGQNDVGQLGQESVTTIGDSTSQMGNNLSIIKLGTSK